MLSYEDMKDELRLFGDDGDPWGTVMSWWFAIADEIYFNRDFDAPTEWQFKPSPIGPSNEPDSYETEVVEQATDDALQKFGALMHRAAQLLKHMNRDY
jgi:hypothetical protein